MEIQLKFVLQIFLALFILNPVLAGPSFLTISDIHYGVENINNDGQDTGKEFFNVAMYELQHLSKQVDFIINLGDMPTHLLFSTPKKAAYEHVVFQGLYQADQTLKPMFYVSGNNDSLGGNYQPFEVNGTSPLHFAKAWNGACSHCDGLLIDDSHMHSKGYYATYVMPNNQDVIMIALNTVPWANPPLLLPKYPNKEQDAQEELQWLEQQLQNHPAKQLLIAMHIPPGRDYLGNALWQEQYQQEFVRLLEKYHHSYQQITLLTSHSHMDEIRKIHLEDETNIYGFSTPAISRLHHNNPGMKIFTLNDGEQLAQFTTYYTTSLADWGNEHYSALGSASAIFPECQKSVVAQCLDQLTDEQVCSYLEDGLFFGVKSSRVHKNVCSKIYRI